MSQAKPQLTQSKLETFLTFPNKRRSVEKDDAPPEPRTLKRVCREKKDGTPLLEKSNDEADTVNNESIPPLQRQDRKENVKLISEEAKQKMKERPVLSQTEMRKMTPEQLKARFFAEVARMRGTVLSEYVKPRSHVLIKCKCGKQRTLQASAVISGSKHICRFCHRNERFIYEFTTIVKNAGGIVVGDWISQKHRIECVCSEGHVCEISLELLRQGRNVCKTCSGRDSEAAERNFFASIKEMGGIVLGKYIQNQTAVDCKCRAGHLCKVIPTAINQGQGMCIVCAKKDSKDCERRFRAIITDVWNGKVVGKYTNCMEYVDLICSNGHACRQTPAKVNYGVSICLQCRSSMGEKRVHFYLKQLGIEFKDQHRFESHPKRPYDFLIKPNIIIEFDGEQHFRPIEVFGGEDAFNKRRQLDIEKTKEAFKQNHRLIRIHHSWLRASKNEQIEFLKQSLQSTEPFVCFNKEAYSFLL